MPPVLLSPITKLINLSLQSGYFLLSWKRALVRSPLKKEGLDPIFKNYRPVSNLTCASKLVETVIAKQLQHYLFSNDQFPVLQSAYRPNHSIETTLLKATYKILFKAWFSYAADLPGTTLRHMSTFIADT